MDDSRSCDRSVAQALRGATGEEEEEEEEDGGTEGSSPSSSPLPSARSPVSIHTYIYSLSMASLL